MATQPPRRRTSGTDTPLILPEDELALPMMPQEPVESATAPKLQPDGSAVIDIESEEEMPEMIEQEDGSVLIPGEEEASPKETGHLANLAETLDASALSSMGLLLIEDIERDITDRKERDEQYAEGIKRTGMTKDDGAGAAFEGSSRVVHPMLLEGCIDFAARTMKEVFPAKGPVKAHIIGKTTREKVERADRKRKYMNWQMTKQIREMRGAFEQMLTQVPLGGSQYLKVWYDERVERPRAEFIPIDKFIIPSAASDLFSAERKTHVQEVTQAEFESRIESGLYIDAPSSALDPDVSAAEEATNKVEGKNTSSMNEDGLRTLYETYVTMAVGDDKKLSPYIITTDKTSAKVIGVYRNWKESDEKREELEWAVEAKFLPWRGPYGVGLMQIAGSLSIAATGALRALLDSAHINNFPGGLKLKGARVAGQSKTTEPTQISEIESAVNVDDIRKLFMPYPYNPPSTVLYQLLELMVQTGKGVIATAEEKIADASSTAPVGTTLAMIEQGSITYSSIHARMHATMERLLAIIHRINGDWIDDEETVEALGELVVRRADFQGPMDVVPVSDPNVFSETQRYAQLQAVLQLRSQFAPGSFKDNALLEQALRLLNYPGYEDILNVPLEAEKRDAIEENYVSGEPQSQLEAYEDQSHLDHLRTHVSFMASPMFAANPLMAAPALPKLLEHCKQHLRMYYKENMRAARTVVQAHGQMIFPEMNGEDAAGANAAAIGDQQMSEELKPIMDAMMEVQQQMAQLIPPPPDPEVNKEQVKAQSAQAIEKTRQDGETARDGQRAQTEQQAEQLRKQQEAQLEQMRASIEQQLEQARAQAEAARHTEEMALAARNADIAEESERNAQQLKAQEARFAEMQATLRNTQDNQTNVIVEQVKALMAAALPPKPVNGEGEASGDAQAKAQLAEWQGVMMQALEKLMTAQTTPKNFVMRRGEDGALFLNQQ